MPLVEHFVQCIRCLREEEEEEGGEDVDVLATERRRMKVVGCAPNRERCG